LLAAVRESPTPYVATGVGQVADALLERGLIAEQWQRVKPEIPAGAAPTALPMR